MTYAERESLLRAACERARAEGLELRPGDYGSRELGYCCAGGALVLDVDGATEDVDDALSVVIGHRFACGMVRGFDGESCSGLGDDDYLAGYATGARLRAEFVEGG